MNEAGLHLMTERLKTFLSSSKPVPGDVAVTILRDSIEEYLKRLKKNGRAVLSAPGQLVDDFVLIYSTTLETSLRHARIAAADNKLYSSTFVQFVEIISASKAPKGSDQRVFTPEKLQSFMRIMQESLVVSRAAFHDDSRTRPLCILPSSDPLVCARQGQARHPQPHRAQGHL